MVASDLDAAERRVIDDLGVELCFRDPGVAAFGLHNALFPVGDQLLEVVSPTQPGTTAGRQLDKRGGDSGYMVILEVEDLDALRARFAAHDARIVYTAEVPGIVGLHLHPADVGGAILSVDQTDEWGEWPWAGPEWRSHVVTDRVAEVLAVQIDADDPRAMAARWGKLLGIEPTGDEQTTVVLPDGGEVRFVDAGGGAEGVSGFELRAASPEHRGQTTICNCRFDIV